MAGATGAREPFGAGSVALLVSPHDAVSLGGPGPAADELVAQAVLAEHAGFDGVLVGEHHAGFPGYLPDPLAAVAWVLEATDTVWVAPAPLLLPLRPTRLVAETLGWLAARFPRRVGVGVGMGAAADDFAVAGVPHEERSARYRAALPELVALCRGQGARLGGPAALAARDPAVAALAEAPLTVVSAAATPAGVRLAASAGAGIMLEGLSGLDRVAGLAAAYRGDGPVVLSRRVQIGRAPTAAARADAARYRAFSAPGVLDEVEGSLIAGPAPEAVADPLDEARTRVGADVLSLRPHLPGASPAEVRAQIEQLGTGVADALRATGSDRGRERR